MGAPKESKNLPNPNQEQLRQVLTQTKTIAVVGLSANPSRDSHRVAVYLQKKGFKIIPVNPKETSILGEKCYSDLKSIPHKVDMVDVFRRSEFVPAIAREAGQIGARSLWLQEGVRHDQAAGRAREKGMQVVQDSCLMVVHRRLMG